MLETCQCHVCPLPVEERQLCLFAIVARRAYTYNYWVEGMDEDMVYKGPYEPIVLSSLEGEDVRHDLIEKAVFLEAPFPSRDVCAALIRIHQNPELGRQVLDCVNKKLDGTCPVV